jgi:hypothetical protein
VFSAIAEVAEIVPMPLQELLSSAEASPDVDLSRLAQAVIEAISAS